jgi:hypothetical protein
VGGGAELLACLGRQALGGRWAERRSRGGAERLGPSLSGRRAKAGGAELLACSAARAVGRAPDGQTTGGGP